MPKDPKQHWEEIYAHKDPLKVSWYQGEPLNSLRLIGNSGIRRDEAIIDIGGGASLLVDRLHAAGYGDLSVLDISDKALSIARQRLAQGASSIKWIEEDITRFQPPHLYSLWHDRAVFHFLTQASDREKYVEALTKALPSGGHVVLAAFAIGGPDKCSGLEIVQYDAPKLLFELGDQFSLVEERFEKHLTPAKAEQKFSYFRLIKK